MNGQNKIHWEVKLVKSTSRGDKCHVTKFKTKDEAYDCFIQKPPKGWYVEQPYIVERLHD